MDLFEQSQKRKDEAFDEYTKKLQREIQRQEFIQNEKLKKKFGPRTGKRKMQSMQNQKPSVTRVKGTFLT